jgi:hypothetical protein
MDRVLRRTGVVVATLLLAGVSRPAHGQTRAPRTLFTINPLGLPFKHVSTELEQKINTFATIGGSFSYLEADDASYTSVEAKLRLYPAEEAFEGFSIGLAGGFSHLADDVGDGTGGIRRETKTVPSIAVIADYNWILGKSKRVVVGTGIGAKRLFGDGDWFEDINFAYPTVRFQVGVVF